MNENKAKKLKKGDKVYIRVEEEPVFFQKLLTPITAVVTRGNMIRAVCVYDLYREKWDKHLTLITDMV